MRATDPGALGAWYRDCLGLDPMRTACGRQETGVTVFGDFRAGRSTWGLPRPSRRCSTSVSATGRVCSATARQGSGRGPRRLRTWRVSLDSAGSPILRAIGSSCGSSADRVFARALRRAKLTRRCRPGSPNATTSSAQGHRQVRCRPAGSRRWRAKAGNETLQRIFGTLNREQLAGLGEPTTLNRRRISPDMTRDSLPRREIPVPSPLTPTSRCAIMSCASTFRSSGESAWVSAAFRWLTHRTGCQCAGHGGRSHRVVVRRYWI